MINIKSIGLEKILQSGNLVLGLDERVHVYFKCQCSESKNSNTYALYVNPGAIPIMFEKSVEVFCRYCKQSYNLELQEVAQTLDELGWDTECSDYWVEILKK